MAQQLSAQFLLLIILFSETLDRLAVTGKQWKQCQTLFFWAPKSLQMVTAAMKLNDTCSLKEKL